LVIERVELHLARRSLARTALREPAVDGEVKGVAGLAQSLCEEIGVARERSVGTRGSGSLKGGLGLRGWCSALAVGVGAAAAGKRREHQQRNQGRAQ
jgi:hypothetical protein